MKTRRNDSGDYSTPARGDGFLCRAEAGTRNCCAVGNAVVGGKAPVLQDECPVLSQQKQPGQRRRTPGTSGRCHPHRTEIRKLFSLPSGHQLPAAKLPGSPPAARLHTCSRARRSELRGPYGLPAVPAHTQTDLHPRPLNQLGVMRETPAPSPMCVRAPVECMHA